MLETEPDCCFTQRSMQGVFVQADKSQGLVTAHIAAFPPLGSCKYCACVSLFLHEGSLAHYLLIRLLCEKRPHAAVEQCFYINDFGEFASGANLTTYFCSENWYFDADRKLFDIVLIMCAANLKNSVVVPFCFFLWRIRESTPEIWYLTIDYNTGCGTASLGHNVAGDAGIVSRIRQAGFRDDEIMVTSSISDTFWAERLFIFQPFHLKTLEYMSYTKSAVVPPTFFAW